MISFGLAEKISNPDLIEQSNTMVNISSSPKKYLFPPKINHILQ